MKAIFGYEEIAEKNQRKSDWLAYLLKKTSPHWLVIAIKTNKSIPKSKTN